MIRQDWSTLKKLMFMKTAAGGGAAVEATATGNPLTFQTDLARPLKSLLIPFTPVQSGSGDPSPQNVRPIVPWEGLKVWNGWKNLFDKTGAVKYNRYLSGEYTSWIYSEDSASVAIPAEPNKTYYMYTVGMKPAIFRANSTDIDNLPTTGNHSTVACEKTRAESTTGELTFTTGDNAKWLIIQVSSALYDSIINSLVVLDTAPTEHEITFPSPVYGGEHEAVSGKLMDAFNFVDLGSKSWKLRSENQNRQVWECVCNDAKFGREGSTYIANALSSQFSLTTSSGVWSVGKFAPSLSNNDKVFIFVVPAGSYASASECKEAMTGIQLVYELATPQEITLIPEQITALVGDNTIWSDADGSMTAVYLKKG